MFRTVAWFFLTMLAFHSGASWIAGEAQLLVQDEPYSPADDAGFSPAILGVVIILFAFVLILVGIGLALAALAIFLFFGLVSLGILSTSLFVGFHQRSFSKGFQVLIVLTTSIVGMVAGALGLGLLNTFQEWWPASMALLMGLAGGLAGGLVLGLCTTYVVRRLTAVLQQKLRPA